MASTYNLVKAKIWAWTRKMCSTTRDLSLQMYALRWNLFFDCRFATPHSPVISWDLAPTFSLLQKLSWVRVVNWFSFYVLCLLFCLSSSCILCTVLPVSLDCSFLIAPSVFSSIYLPLCDTYISHYNISMQMLVFL